MHKLLFYFFTIFCLYGSLNAEATFTTSTLYDLKKNKYEQYQDVYVQGRVISRASYGERFLEDRFKIVNNIFKKYTRPFTVFDIGASQGYFSFRGAELYPESVFVMLEGNNETYPAISSQLDSICKLNSYLTNFIWLNRQILPNEIKKLSKAEHFDVILLLNILHWFPKDWQTLLEAAIRMSHVTVIELPPLEEQVPFLQKQLRANIHKRLQETASEVIQGVPRHNDPSLYTTYYILENGTSFNLETGSLYHEKSDRVYEIFCDYHSKHLIKTDKVLPHDSYRSDWIPGINLITYLMFNGHFPTRNTVRELLPVDSTHRDWMPNNMIISGRTLHLIDFNDPKNDPGAIGGYTKYTENRLHSFKKFILRTANLPRKEVKEMFRKYAQVDD